MADQIVLLQPLHGDDDGASLLVVLPAIEGVIVPFVGGSSLRFGERLFGLERVIDNDDVGAAPGQRAAVRAGDPVALVGGDELLHSLAVGCQEEIVFRAAAGEGIKPRIAPDIGAVAAKPAELDVVAVPAAAVFEDKDKLVLAAVERAHP